MSVAFQIQAIPAFRFEHLMKLSKDQLAREGAKRITADSEPGYPCRVSLQDAAVGEQVIALSFMYHDVDSPYRASGPIFIRENAVTAKLAVNEIPKMLRGRLLSIRAYDAQKSMLTADVHTGDELESVIEAKFDRAQTAYIHIHNAKPGCFNCAVYRAS